jgi:hypothetical protein
MNDEDLRDCFAMFIANGMISRSSAFDWKEVWEMADAMLEARNQEPEQEVGIVAAKPRRKKSA